MEKREVDSFLHGYLPYLLQRADQLLSARFHRYLTESGVQGSEWRILVVLSETGPLTVGGLTQMTLLPQPTATHAIGRLEERGAVTRRTDARDARLRIVRLTARGRTWADTLKCAAHEHLRLTLLEAGLEVPRQLVEGLTAISQSLERPAGREAQVPVTGSPADV